MKPKHSPLGNILPWTRGRTAENSRIDAEYHRILANLIFLRFVCGDEHPEHPGKLAERPRDHAWAPDRSRLVVPSHLRWPVLLNRALAQDARVADVLKEAAQLLEACNPVLRGTVTAVDFGDAPVLSSPARQDHVLRSVVQALDQAFANEEHFSFEIAWQMCFPPADPIQQFLVDVLDPCPGVSIYDPVCGRGEFLLACAKQVAGNCVARFRDLDLTLHGQDKNPEKVALARMNLYLHGLLEHEDRVRVELGDSLRDPKFVADGHLMTYDRVAGIPPVILKNWGWENAPQDPYQRYRFGLPAKHRGDFAFVSHMVTSLNERGKAAVLLPLGALFRTSTERAIRQALLAEDLVEAVFVIPEAFKSKNRGIKGTVLVLRRGKPPERQGKVLLVTSPAGNLSESFLVQAVEAYRTFEVQPGLARVVTVDEVARQDFDLNPSRYEPLEVRSTREFGRQEFEHRLGEIRALDDARDQHAVAMDKILNDIASDMKQGRGQR